MSVEVHSLLSLVDPIISVSPSTHQRLAGLSVPVEVWTSACRRVPKGLTDKGAGSESPDPHQPIWTQDMSHCCPRASRGQRGLCLPLFLTSQGR